ncbi:hypothetical protein TNCV_3452821 [Trichonephila clavipes]|nr:hypothetical protein TNCV_3452821 [Trichonephila clavipes]
MYHSVSTRTIRHRLRQSGNSRRRPLLRLPLTRNHRRLSSNTAMNGGHGERPGYTINFRSTLDQLWQNAEAAWTAVPDRYIQSLFVSMPMFVVKVTANNDSYNKY